MRRLALPLMIILVLALSLVACQPVSAPSSTGTAVEGEPGTKEGGWIMAATIEDPDSLDPHKTIMATASSIQGWDL